VCEAEKISDNNSQIVSLAYSLHSHHL